MFSEKGDHLDIFVYSDESGVFDKEHNDIFVFGGIICLGKIEKDAWSRKYSSAEKSIRQSLSVGASEELKASVLNAKHKNSLYRLLNNCYKFGAVIDQAQVLEQIFNSKKDKQRYLDYAYKIAIKYAFADMISKHIIDPNDVESIWFHVDEHTTATNGKYELREALEQELKRGTYNVYYSHFFPPIFPKVKTVDLKFCDSTTVRLVRAADIVANHFYYIATKHNSNFKEDIDNHRTFIKMLP